MPSSVRPWGELGSEHANCDILLPGVLSGSPSENNEMSGTPKPA